MMKGVSSIVALILILLITVSLGTMLFFYLTGSQQELTGLVEQQQEIELRKVSSEMKILGADPNSGNITIRNTGRFDLDKFNLFLNGIQTQIVPLDKLMPGETGVISPVTKPDPGDYEIKITATYAEAYGFLVIPPEGDPIPKWSLLDQNSSTGTAFELSAYRTDDVMLGYAILSTNETGVWANSTTSSLGAQNAWSNFTWSGSLTEGTIVAWRIYANDSDSNENVTSIMTFNYTSVVGTPNPKWWNPYVSTYITYTRWTDAETEVDSTWLSTNETGSYLNYTAREASWVIDDMIDNATWIKGLPWVPTSGTSIIYMNNITNAQIRDGTEMRIVFGTPGLVGCLNGTTLLDANYQGNDIMQFPVDLHAYSSIVYWAYTDSPFTTMTSITVGSNYNNGYCTANQLFMLNPGWNRIEVPVDAGSWVTNWKDWDYPWISHPSCDPTQIDEISIWFTTADFEYDSGMCFNFVEAEFRVDELYLRNPPHDDFTTLFTWKNDAIGTGTPIGWRIYANDTDGYENVTSVGTIIAP